MRLLLVSNIFPNPWQPVKGTFNFALTRALARDHEVHVVAPIAWTDELVARWKGWSKFNRRGLKNNDRITVYHPRYYFPPKILRSRYGWFYWQSVQSTFRRLIADGVPDCILSYWAHPDGEAAVRLARGIKAPAVVMVGGSDVLLLTKHVARRSRVLRVLQEADAVVTVGTDLKEAMVRQGIPASKIHIAYRGVDTSLFFPGDRGQARQRLGIPDPCSILLYVGRLEFVKGVDVLLGAAADLRRRGRQFRLFLAGDGPERRSLEAQCRAMELSRTVTFLGAMRQEHLGDWYRAADLTVLPSRSEGIPNVLRESLACGTPFVASNVGGIPEIAAGTASRIVPAENAALLADALDRALAVPRPPTEAQRPLLSWDESAEVLLSVIRPLVSTSGSARGAPVRDGALAFLHGASS
jgi:glycosyltransferase involved in cell wall biosynthesis